VISIIYGFTGFTMDSAQEESAREG
jgi:hypothetical protein